MIIIDLSKSDKDREIQNILSKGLVKPKSLPRYLTDLYKALGFRYIFFNMSYFLIPFMLLLGFVVQYFLSPKQYVYTALFAMASIFFPGIVLFAEMVEKMSGLYELKMTCKYSIQQIVAFRMLCFSMIGLIFCVSASFYLVRFLEEINLIVAFSIPLCALFLCAFFTTCVLRQFRCKWGTLIIMLIWIVGCLFLSRFHGERLELFFSKLPVAVTLIITLTSFLLFLREIKKHMRTCLRKQIGYSQLES